MPRFEGVARHPITQRAAREAEPACGAGLVTARRSQLADHRPEQYFLGPCHEPDQPVITRVAHTTNTDPEVRFAMESAAGTLLAA